jgi:hypothetical protein
MNERKTVFLLFLAALGFRLLHYWIFSHELVVGGDQMQNILLAQRFADGEFYGVLHPYWTPLYPILIGVVTFFIDSRILPSLIISILAGALAAPAVFYLVRQSYGAREAAIAAAIAVFYPHLINSVFALGTENVFLLLIAGLLIVGWKALQNDSPKDYFLTGILVGLAYLTRPEGFGYVGFFGLLILGKSFWQKSAPPKILLKIAALLLGFLILAAPYLFYLKSETGTWTISAKSDVNFASGIYSEDAPTENEEPEKFTSVVAYNLLDIHKNFPYLFPIFLLVFVALGLFGERWSRQRLWRESYLIFFCLVTIAGYAATVVQTRYFYILLPVLFGWTARGIVQMQQWLKDSARIWLPEKFAFSADSRYFVSLCLILVYLYLLPLNFFMQSREKAWQVTAYEERAAGLWLKENGKPSARIFSVTQRPVFYAEGRQMSPVSTNLENILAEIKAGEVDYVIHSDRSLKRNPYMKGFAEILQNSPQFELVYENNENPDYKIFVFKQIRNSK